MIRQLVADQESIVKAARAVIAAAGAADDDASADLDTRRIDLHQKSAWMLRSHLEQSSGRNRTHCGGHPARHYSIEVGAALKQPARHLPAACGAWPVVNVCCPRHCVGFLLQAYSGIISPPNRPQLADLPETFTGIASSLRFQMKSES